MLVYKTIGALCGGFLWVLADEGVVRRDLGNRIDTDGNHGADGIVGPYGEKEGSYYTIKEVWSPVQIKKPVFNASFNGKLEVENNYIYSDLSSCKFSWKLIKYPLAKDTKLTSAVLAFGTFSQALAPGTAGLMQLPLPRTWNQADALQLRAVDQYGQELFTWTWPIKTPADIIKSNLSVLKATSPAKEVLEGTSYSIINDGITYTFDSSTGYLSNVTKANREITFGTGPVLAGVKQTLQNFRHQKSGNSYVVEAAYTGDAVLNVKWTFTPGSPAKLFLYSNCSC